MSEFEAGVRLLIIALIAVVVIGSVAGLIAAVMPSTHDPYETIPVDPTKESEEPI